MEEHIAKQGGIFCTRGLLDSSDLKEGRNTPISEAGLWVQVLAQLVQE